MLNLVSLFSGAGGLDLGFEKSGFKVEWANEFDKEIWETFESNFPNTKLDKRSITQIPSEDIPNTIGIIGGPPCQSWSEIGSSRKPGEAIKDKRGQLFFEYIRILKDKQPMFFLAENVRGMVLGRNKAALELILDQFKSVGYNVNYELLDTNDYGVPQNRLRIIVVGYHKSLGIKFKFPKKSNTKLTLKDALKDLPEYKFAVEKNKANHPNDLNLANHEVMTGAFSSIYMSRNRVRSWDEPSFTIQAGGRHAPIHPNAPKMLSVGKDRKIFVPGSEVLYRRLSVRECARIQTFPDDFIFKYDKIAAGYKMVGNAVPVEFARVLSEKIKHDLQTHLKNPKSDRSSKVQEINNQSKQLSLL